MRQITGQYGRPEVEELEERVHHLEARLADLSRTVEELRARLASFTASQDPEAPDAESPSTS